jgi:hypothetical protein
MIQIVKGKEEGRGRVGKKLLRFNVKYAVYDSASPPSMLP